MTQLRPLLKRLPVRCIVADKHRIVAEGLKALLECNPDFACVGSTCSATELEQILTVEKPDILLTGLCIEGEPCALQILRKCRRQFPDMGLVVLSMYTLPFTIAEVARAGAHAFVAKDESYSTLAETILRVAIGQRDIFPKHFKMENEPGLSERETAVFICIAEGKTAEETARELSICTKTVELYRTRLLHRFGQRKSTDLVRIALISGILPSR